ncbi:MAG TPA: hypothetical protein VGG72_30950 [Bryobacteraceae bacterium]
MPNSLVTIEVEYDYEAEAFVTCVKELHGISTFGDTKQAALENAAEMIRGYISRWKPTERKSLSRAQGWRT